MHILDKLHWCVMETSFLVHNASLCALLAYAHASIGWTSSAHRYGKYTENIIFRVFLVFFLPEVYGEQKATLWCRRNRSAHVS